jgi:hypothetical protein
MDDRRPECPFRAIVGRLDIVAMEEDEQLLAVFLKAAQELANFWRWVGTF